MLLGSRRAALVLRNGRLGGEGSSPFGMAIPPNLIECMLLERRAHNRYWINRAATASFGSLVLSKRCRLRDASADGLGLWLDGIRLLPIELDFEIEGNLVPVHCRLIYRYNDFAGFRFV
jgi:hypothetical protein